MNSEGQVCEGHSGQRVQTRFFLHGGSNDFPLPIARIGV